MANVGSFDAEIRALAWFDSTAVAGGWYDYGMPFSHPLIGQVYSPPLIQSAKKDVSGVNNTTLAYSANVTAGNLLVVNIVTYQSTPGTTISTPTDTLGHTYQSVAALQNNAADTVHLQSWYVPNCLGGANTVTADISGAGTGEITMFLSEWSGRDLSAPLSGTPSLNSGISSGTPTSGDVTPAHDNCLLLGVVHFGGQAGVTSTEEAGWNLLEEYEATAGTVSLASEWKMQTTATAEDADWTLSASKDYLAHVIAFRPTAVATELVGHWMLNETSGTSASDSSGGANTGTLTGGPVWTTGRIGGGLEFDGTDDYVAINGIADDLAIGSFTIAFWFKPAATFDSSHTTDDEVFSNAAAASNNDMYVYLGQSDGTLKFEHKDSVGSNRTLVSTTTSWTGGVWYHAACTFEISVAKKLYVNGIEQATIGTDCTRGATASDVANIGRYYGGDYFAGTIDDVRVYNYALTGTEVLAVYNAAFASLVSKMLQYH